jgi:DHA2 family multidrug resistance protein-like MFS transporter
VLNSAYGAHVFSSLTALGAPASLGHLAGQSVVAGMNVAARFPAPLRDAAAAAVRSAFMTGIHRGSLVAAGATLAAALMALAFLPARAAASEDLLLVRTEEAETLPSMTQVNS